MSRIQILCGLVGCSVLLTAIPANAQFNDGGHNDVIHHGNHHDVVHHHGSHFGNSNWNYVVPPNRGVHQHSGSFYVQGDTHYYTPTPIARIAPASFQSAHVHPTPVVQQPVPLQFGDFSRIEDLAGRLETEANRLCLDMFYNYQHNPGFAGTYKEAYSLLESSKYVHAKQHQGDREAIRQQVTQMDGLLHHVQGELRQWSRNHARQVGSGEIIEKSSAVEAILHHLCYDVGIEPHGDDEPAPAPSVGEEQAPAPGGVIGSPPPSF